MGSWLLLYSGKPWSPSSHHAHKVFVVSASPFSDEKHHLTVRYILVTVMSLTLAALLLTLFLIELKIKKYSWRGIFSLKSIIYILCIAYSIGKECKDLILRRGFTLHSPWGTNADILFHLFGVSQVFCLLLGMLLLLPWSHWHPAQLKVLGLLA